MENPLNLPSGRKALMIKLGRKEREANRQKEYEQILRRAMSIFRLHIPKMLDIPPDTSLFEEKWPTVDKHLRKDLKSEVAYRRAYSFICRQIEIGNQSGIWSLTPPPAYLTLRRNRPLRNLSWQKRSNFIANAEHKWFLQPGPPSNDPERLFTYLLLSCILYGGLNRPELWSTLGDAVNAKQPLQGHPECCWLTLRPAHNSNIATNLYIMTEAQEGRIPIAEVHYFPDPISLGLLRQFLLHKPANWQPPPNITGPISVIKQALNIDCSPRELSQGGVSVAESQVGIVLPQVLVEFALGRQPSASLPNDYWVRLFNPACSHCNNDQFSRFHPLQFVQQYDAGKEKSRQYRERTFLLSKLKEIFKHTPAHPKGKKDIIEELRILDAKPLTLSQRVLVKWLLSHLAERGNAISTASIYLDNIGADWLSTALNEELDSYTGGDFFELYQSILNRPRSQKSREYQAGRLEDMHQFAVHHFDFAPLPEPLSESTTSQPHVSAAIIDEPLFAALLQQIDQFKDVDELHGRMLKSFLIMGYRTGLRPGELAKLRLRDIEPSSIGWLFIRENKHGHNKTDAALRKVPLYPLLTTDEHEFVAIFIRERRLQAKSVKELLFHKPGNPVEPIDTKQMSLMVKTVLAALSGGLYYRLYHLRHSALSRLQLLLHHDQINLPQPVQALLPYQQEQRESILHLIAGRGRLRDRYAALAVFAGHSSPDITLSTYLHFTDLLLGCHLSSNQKILPPDAAMTLLGLKQHRVTKLHKEGEITPAKLNEYIRKSLTSYITLVPGKLKQQVEVTSLQLKPSHYVQAMAVLSKYQAGLDYREIACFYQINQELVQRWFDAAKALRQLRTCKGKSRLFPKSRRHQILPAEPLGVDERNDVAKALKACQMMRHDEKQKSELHWAIKYCLLNSNSSRAGIRFTQSADLNRFMQVVTQMFPWQRWQVLLQYPKGKRLAHWNIDKKLTIHRFTLKMPELYPEGLCCLFLRHAQEEQHIKRGLSRYSSHSLRILFHRLAIILFKPDDIKRWQQE